MVACRRVTTKSCAEMWGLSSMRNTRACRDSSFSIFSLSSQDTSTSAKSTSLSVTTVKEVVSSDRMCARKSDHSTVLRRHTEAPCQVKDTSICTVEPPEPNMTKGFTRVEPTGICARAHRRVGRCSMST